MTSRARSGCATGHAVGRAVLLLMLSACRWSIGSAWGACAAAAGAARKAPASLVAPLFATMPGGRAPTTPNDVPAEGDDDILGSAVDPTVATFTLVQITDVYTLANFPRLVTLMRQLKARNPGNTVGVMTGDFLSPYLLSTIDEGNGMMTMVNAEDTVDFVTWGNHEADLPHDVVCRHVRECTKVFINSNMLDHETMDQQAETVTLDVTSADGSHTRKVGLCAVLSDDPALYAHFPAPGAFGGATIDNPYETLARNKAKLEGEGCDVVVPLQHMYVPDDRVTCRRFDFPVVLSGHDHHRVDEVKRRTQPKQKSPQTHPAREKMGLQEVGP